MRFTKKLCALVSSLAVTASAQTVAQTPAPAAAPANDTDDAKLRDALRKALDTGASSTVAPAAPVLPTTPATPNAPTILTNAPQGIVVPSYSYSATNVGVSSSVTLSLQQAIELALQHNLQLRVARYTPMISELNRLSLYGYYDPILTGEYSHSRNTREGGGFNANTGRETPAQHTDVDAASLGVTGVLPTGMTYDIGHNVENVVANRPVQIGTNSFGQPIFAKATSDTWDGGAGITLSQPLLRNFWIDPTRLQIKLARRNVRVAELQFERNMMDVVNQVEKAYYALIAARELVRVGEADVTVKRQFFDEQRRRVEVGTLAPLAEKLAQSELALSDINLVVARNNAIEAERVLKGLIHDNYVAQLGVQIIPTDKLMAVPPSLELFEAFREAVDKRPDLQVQRLNLEKQQIQLKFQFNQLFPSLDIFGTLRFNGLDRHIGGVYDDIARRDFQQDMIGLRFEIPFTFWTERKQYKAAEVAKEQQIWALKQLEDSIVQEVDTEVRLLRTTWNTIPMRREQVAYQQAALEAERRLLEVGKSTSFNVLKIASDLAHSQSDEIGTLRDYNQAVSELSFRKGTTLERWHIDSPRTDR